VVNPEHGEGELSFPFVVVVVRAMGSSHAVIWQETERNWICFAFAFVFFVVDKI